MPSCPYCYHPLTRSEIARLMGGLTSDKKAEAARRNAKRPRPGRKKETEYQKAIRTGIKPAIWPPIVMTREDLEHFRAHLGSGSIALEAPGALTVDNKEE